MFLWLIDVMQVFGRFNRNGLLAFEFRQVDGDLLELPGDGAGVVFHRTPMIIEEGSNCYYPLLIPYKTKGYEEAK